MAFTVGNSNTKATVGPVTSDTITLTVTAGSLVVLGIRWTSSTAILSVVDDNAVPLSLGTSASESGVYVQFAWHLSVPTAGDRTYTITFDNIATMNIRTEIYEFAYIDTCTKEAENWGTGSGTTGESGTISIAGAAEKVILGNGAAAAISNQQIGGVAADGHIEANAGNSLWYKTYNTTVTDITASFSTTSSIWLCNVIGFKEPGAIEDLYIPYVYG